MEVVQKINEVYTNDEGKPLQVVRIKHTIILEDPFPDPKGLEELIPDRSPVPSRDQW
jgi:peptidyl-prolyl cis-trans isomerase-like 4